MSQRHHIRRGFSLIELIIVVVIIGIIAAIAIPRLSRGAQGAGDSALSGDLSILRSAIDLYAAEHNSSYPDVTNFVAKLTTYSDASGNTASTKNGVTGIIYGPYLRSIPPLPVGPSAIKGSTTVVDGTTGTPTGLGGGWFYNPNTGAIQANTTTDADVNNKAYNAY